MDSPTLLLTGLSPELNQLISFDPCPYSHIIFSLADTTVVWTIFYDNIVCVVSDLHSGQLFNVVSSKALLCLPVSTSFFELNNVKNA